MAVNDQQIQDRLRQLGSSGQAPELPVARIVAAGRVRHRRRLVGSVGAVLVLLASPYAVWAARQASVGDAPVTAAAVTSRTTSTAAATVSRAVTSPAPRPPLGAPGCPPGPPNLVQRPSVDAPVLSRPVQAAAGGTVTFSAAQHLPSASDRPILSVQLIVARPLGQWTAEKRLGGVKLSGLDDLKNPENQIAASQIVTSPGDLEIITVSIPARTRPGSYPVFMVTTWPGPSVCGRVNENPLTPQGTSWGQAATLSVTGSRA